MGESGGRSAATFARRQVLCAGGAGAVVLGLSACGGTKDPSPAGTRVSATLAQPHVLTSTNGRLEVTLKAEAGTVPYGDGTRFAYTYNGSIPGPTLHVRPGDTLVITLENHLDEPTNLHTHGLHVSPEGDADNVFVQVDPGQSHIYTYQLPSDHRSSLCWYHPHHHGMVAPQLSAGLFGGIIIEDSIDRIPELAASTERLLVLSDPTIGDTSSVLDVSGMQRMQGREGDAALVNGLQEPVITAPAGSLERWRILNASPSRYYRLALDGHRLHVIGTDGGRLAALDPGTAGSQRPIELAMGMGGGNGGMGGGMGSGGMMSFTVNGASFDPNRTNITARAGDTEDWVITNTSSMDHPFHLHASPRAPASQPRRLVRTVVAAQSGLTVSI